MVGKFYSFPIRVSGYIKARIEFVFTTLLWSNGNRSKIKIWKSSCNNSGRRVFGCGKLTQGSSNSRILIDETIICLNITKNGTHYDQSIFRLSWISSVARKEGIFWVCCSRRIITKLKVQTINIDYFWSIKIIQNLKLIDNSDDIDSLTSEYLLKQENNIFQQSDRLKHKTKSRTKSRPKRQDVTAKQETGQSSVFITINSN